MPGGLKLCDADLAMHRDMMAESASLPIRGDDMHLMPRLRQRLVQMEQAAGAVAVIVGQKYLHAYNTIIKEGNILQGGNNMGAAEAMKLLPDNRETKYMLVVDEP